MTSFLPTGPNAHVVAAGLHEHFSARGYSGPQSEAIATSFCEFASDWRTAEGCAQMIHATGVSVEDTRELVALFEESVARANALHPPRP